MRTLNTPFEWQRAKHYPGTYCTWNGLTLHAFNEGAWKVLDGTTVLDHFGNSTPDTDIHGAQRRAQAAAMIINSLRSKP